jgi:predicted metal-dependent phosphoesterase TrpH
MIRVELHAHTSDDPADRIPHTTRELIDRAAQLGYGALAITLHDHQLDPAPYAAYARERGITLIPGVERTFGRVHVLLLNYPAEAASLSDFDDLAALRRRHPGGLVVVPHPCYPIGSAMGIARLDAYRDLVDAVEWNAMYAPGLNFNTRAAQWARENGKPIVGNSDIHRLEQMGPTTSLVDVEAGADANAICEAIRAGRVTLETTPLSWPKAIWLFARMTAGGKHFRHHARVPATS